MSSADLNTIYRYLSVSDKLGTAGQPQEDEFAAIAEAGYEIVINLHKPDAHSGLPDERDIVTGLGMTYVHIPVVWNAPTLEDLEQFFAVMDQYKDRKVFVHCAANLRVSCFVFLYRVIRWGVQEETARESLRQIWKPNAVWSRFVAKALDHCRPS